ncbi:MAG: ribosome recycling factor [Endomicrobia bacterium]|nr:ribosome recycling factor [Endomicrobiia bacterium]
MIKELYNKTEELMKKTIEKCKSEFVTIRTGRASISLVENIEVECYNNKMKLSQISNINIIDGRIIEMRPWDSSNLVNIEKAILNSPLGLTPINDGKSIKVTVPALTDERRQELIRHINKVAEDFRVAIRNERRLAIESLRQYKKDKKISEDDERHGEQQIQKLTETYIKKIDDLLNQKVKEINES